MNSKHTPGPWIHATDIGQVGSVELPDGLVIAQTQSLPDDPRNEQRNANARLAAAAPDMLAVLLSMLDALEGQSWDGALRFDRVVNAAREAVHKATGESW